MKGQYKKNVSTFKLKKLFFSFVTEYFNLIFKLFGFTNS